MSKDMKMGLRSRKIMTIMLAAFAVALMIAVPLFAAVDTDADLTEASKGYSIDMVNPTDEQLDAIETSRYGVILFPLLNGLGMFNSGTLGVPSTVTMDSLSYQKAVGGQVTATQYKEFNVSNTTAENVKIEFTIGGTGSLFVPEEYMSDPQKAAANAITTYLGSSDLGAGDKVTITGKIKEQYAINDYEDYKMLADNKCIITKDSVSIYVVDDIDLTMAITKAGSTTPKEIKFVSTVKGTIMNNHIFEYKSDDIKVGTAYTLKNEISSILSGKTYYLVNGTEYGLAEVKEADAPQQRTVVADDIDPQSSIVVDPDIEAKMATLPASATGMTISKEFSSAESMYDNVVMEAVGDDILKVLLVAGGVILAIIILVIILIIILIVRRKK